MSSGRILIVDDSENIRSVLRLNFEYLGYEVLSARDGEEALRLMESEHPDVVILDVMMPRQNGFQVCRKIKSDPKHAATVAEMKALVKTIHPAPVEGGKADGAKQKKNK